MDTEKILTQAIELYTVIDSARAKAREDQSESMVILNVIAKMADELVGSIRELKD